MYTLDEIPITETFTQTDNKSRNISKFAKHKESLNFRYQHGPLDLYR